MTEHWMSELQRQVNARIDAFFHQKRTRFLALWTARTDDILEQRAQHAHGHEARTADVELVDEIFALTQRGGKRLRPALAYAASRAVGGEPSMDSVAELGCSLELLQTYLLIHDDWMDRDESRRGGPSVHRVFADRHRDEHLGAALAVLAGDLACTFAWELFWQTPFAKSSQRSAMQLFGEMQEEVVLGQYMDLVRHPDVWKVEDLKTGSYTVRGPVRLGAMLGGGTDAQQATLEQYARPLGVLFQLRDDMLGTFGSEAQTGKPTGNDVREGKRTSLIRFAENHMGEESLRVLRTIVGNAHATDEQIEHVKAMLDECGAVAWVESSIEQLLHKSCAALDPGRLREDGIAMLRQAAELIARRTL